MEKSGWNLKDFLQTPLGVIIAFVLVFYVMTFAVYYFYSPGPEERRETSELRITN